MSELSQESSDPIRMEIEGSLWLTLAQERRKRLNEERALCGRRGEY